MLDILYEDKYIIAVRKTPGMLSEEAQSTDSIPLLLKEEKGITAYTLHRLDKPVGGVIIYAKDSRSAAAFSRLIAENGLTKKYLTVTDGIPAEKEGRMCDLLFKDSRKNKTFVVSRMRKGVKEASLTYKTLAADEKNALIIVTLETGRSHQIRAQFASRKTPLTGDGKYGSRDNKCNVALFSHSIAFTHPFTKETLCIEAEPDFSIYPWSLFRKENGM